jgi:hypothetical protein
MNDLPLHRVGDVDRMTLRDYFAAQALVGILSSNTASYTDWNIKRAYAHADEMLKRRELG